MTEKTKATVNKAYFKRGPDQPPSSGLGTLGHWCPWCERVHTHGARLRGAKPRMERRGSHCDESLMSPNAGRSIDLHVVGEVAELNEITCKSMITNKRGRFIDTILDKALVCRLNLLRSLPGLVLYDIQNGCCLGEIDGTAFFISFDREISWSIYRTKRKKIIGNGMSGFIGTLYGIPRGVVAARLLWLVDGVHFEGTTTLSISESIENDRKTYLKKEKIMTDIERPRIVNVMIRLPHGMRPKLKALAAENNRSVNKEIIERLYRSFSLEEEWHAHMQQINQSIDRMSKKLEALRAGLPDEATNATSSD